MSPSITATLPEFKRMTKEFHDLLPGSTAEQAESGFKALGLAYLGLKLRDDVEEIEAPIVLKIASKMYIDFMIGATNGHSTTSS